MHTTDGPDARNGGRLPAFAIGLLCGAATGAALGLLFAPKSGARLRRDIGAKADRAKRKAADLYDDVTEAATDLAQRGRQMAEAIRR